MTNTIDTTWVSDEPFPFYPSGTKMFFKVFAVGADDDTTETYKFMYTVRPFEYCESYGSMVWGTGVTLIDFSDLNNPSGKLAPYTSYIDMDTATVYRTNDYDLTMNISTDGPYTIHGKAWIDWNRDGDFSDIGESYDLGTTYDSDDGITTLSPLNITIPADAHLGKTTMRVAAKYASDPSECEVGFDGEVEDYTIYVKPLIALDFEIAETNICQGESISFEYTGTDLDSISWSFTNDIDTYTSTEMEGSLVFDEPGDYNLTLYGYVGGITDEGSWIGIVHVHPNFNEDISATICIGEEFILGTQTLTESGVYSEPFLSEFGCDSIVTLTLEVTSIDIAVTATDFELTAVATDVTYQWLDCNAGWAEIAGANEQSFEPFENGSYAVIITDGDCADTSDCYDIVALSINELLGQGVNLYPNPSNGSFQIQLDQSVTKLNLEVYDASGRLVYSNNYENTATIDIKLDQATGVYYLVMNGLKDEKVTFKIMIK